MMIEIKHAAEAGSAQNLLPCRKGIVAPTRVGARHLVSDKFAANSLMEAFVHVVFRKFLDHKTQMTFPEKYEVVEAFVFDGPDKPFSVGIAVRAHRRGFHAGHAAFAKKDHKRVRKQRVSIVNQIFRASKEAVKRIGQVSGDLFHPVVSGNQLMSDFQPDDDRN